jgi:outer membrane protein, heavy metal efflux system
VTSPHHTIKREYRFGATFPQAAALHCPLLRLQVTIPLHLALPPGIEEPIPAVKKFFPPLSFALFAALVCGCANQQSYEPKALDPKQTAAQFHARNLDEPALRRFMVERGYPDTTWPPVQWGLSELTLAALYFHPEVNVARAHWNSARTAVVTAASRDVPGLEIVPEFHSRTGGGLSPWSLGLVVDFRIVRGGKRAARVEQATLSAEAARLDIGAAAWQVRSRLRGRLVDYQAAQSQAALAAREIETRSEITRLLEHRLALGAIANADMAPARVLEQEARFRGAQAQLRLDSALPALADAMGLPLQKIIGLEIAFKQWEQPPAAASLDAAALEAAALTNRLNIRRALLRYAATEAAFKLEIHKQYPDLQLRPGYAWDQGDKRWALGVGFSLPLPGSNAGPIGEARLERESERAKFVALQAAVIGEVAQAWSAYRGALQQWQKTSDLNAGQARQYQLVRLRFAKGQADQLDMATAQAELLLGERQRLEALTALQNAWGRLEDALERPLDESQQLRVPDDDPRQAAQ